MVRIQNLSKHYGDLTILSDINIHIKRGEIHGLLGVSGAGKSTLLRCINGLETFDSGSLQVDGVEISSLSGKAKGDFQKKMGLIFQNFALLERKSVFDNVALPMEFCGMSRTHIRDRVDELLALVGISEKRDVRSTRLSGGQKQRVAIARALALNPEILLCDEATSALDPSTTGQILQLIDDINKKMGITVIMVTHEMSVVKAVCDRVSVMESGRIAVSDTVENIFLSQPPALRSLMGAGEQAADLPDTSIRICYRSTDTDNPILSTLATQLKVPFTVKSAQVDTYKDKQFGHIVIDVPPEDVGKVRAYCDEQNILYQCGGREGA